MYDGKYVILRHSYENGWVRNLAINNEMLCL